MVLAQDHVALDQMGPGDEAVSPRYLLLILHPEDTGFPSHIIRIRSRELGV